jgi:hypothetical protein
MAARSRGPPFPNTLKCSPMPGLVTATPKGTSRLYAVDPHGLAPLRAYLDSVWGDVLGAFAAEVENQTNPSNQDEPS